MLLLQDSPHSSCPLCISSGSGSARRSPAGLRPSNSSRRRCNYVLEPSHRDHQSICFPITTDPNHPGITLARETQSFYFLVRETNHSVVRILQTELPSSYSARKLTCTPESQLPAEYTISRRPSARPKLPSFHRIEQVIVPLTSNQVHNLSRGGGVYEIIY